MPKNRVFIPNLSWWTNSLIDCFIRNLTFVKACKLKKKQFQETSFTSNILCNKLISTKKILRVKKPINHVTKGSPKCAIKKINSYNHIMIIAYKLIYKSYGDGELIIVIALKYWLKFLRSVKLIKGDMARVMFSEYKEAQRNILINFNNITSRHKSSVNINNIQFFNLKLRNNFSKVLNKKKQIYSAIKYVTKWNKVQWFIKGNIDTYFIKNKLCDEEFQSFDSKIINPRYFNFIKKEKTSRAVINLLKESVWSSILFPKNLNEFDEFIKIKLQKFKQSTEIFKSNFKNNMINTEILRLQQYWFPSYRYRKIFSKAQEVQNLKEVFKLKKFWTQRLSIIRKSNLHFYYIRYINSFLVGITGNYKLAEQIKIEIKNFFNYELTTLFNLKTIKITSSKKGVIFLGVYIKKCIRKIKSQKKINFFFNYKYKKTLDPFIVMAPIKLIVKKLQSYGICKIIDLAKPKIIPTRKTAWISLDTKVIINKYNHILQSILNYYPSFVFNRYQLKFIKYLLQHSAACTLMNKFKLSSRRQVFKKRGKFLKINESNKIYFLNFRKNVPFFK
nr:hypothetical protein Paeru_mt_14 [Porphyridium aerugineum]